jgi:hypothetical protein
MANEILLRRKRVLAAKIEGTAGTAEALTGTEAAFNAFDAIMQPGIEMEGRESQGRFAPLYSTPGPGMGTISFSMELHGGGTVPAWAAVFLAGCGFKDNGSGVFSRNLIPPATSGGQSTLTLATYISGVKKQIHGAQGNAVFRFVPGRKAMVDFTFTGKIPVYHDSARYITDTAILAPTYPTTTPLRFANNALTIGGYAAGGIGGLTIDLGNQVYMVEDAADTSGSGYKFACISGGVITGSIDPELRLVATKDFHHEWLTSTEQALAFALTGTSQYVGFAAPALQFTNLQEQNRSDITTEGITFQLNGSTSATNDEFTITVDDAAPE